MDNPYQPPRSTTKRTFKTSLSGRLLSITVVLIYLGYAFLFFRGEEIPLFSLLTNISFEIFILCELSIIIITLYNKKQFDAFLNEYPVINSKLAIEKLKPSLRVNMYSVYFNLLFFMLGTLVGIMTILNHGLVESIIVVVLSILVSRISSWYSSTEENIKQIDCTEALESELTTIFESWLYNSFPNF